MPHGSVSYPFNDEFTSNHPKEVAKFYDHFRSRDELIAWMKNRPMGRALISEVEGRKDLIVVIPTADVHGPLAAHCRDQVFKGQHIVFVESGGRSDPLFNYARNTNIGVRHAMEHHPEWIIIAGDDALKMDDVQVLDERLKSIDPSRFDTVFTRPGGYYHSVMANLGRQTLARRAVFGLTSIKRSILELEHQFGVYLLDSRATGWHSLLTRRGYRHLSFAAFGIFSGEYVSSKCGKLLDEVMVNAGEDVELSLRLTRDPERVGFVDYRIGELVGATLGTGDARRLRHIAGNAYLQYLMEQRPKDYFPETFDYERLLRE